MHIQRKNSFLLYHFSLPLFPKAPKRLLHYSYKKRCPPNIISPHINSLNINIFKCSHAPVFYTKIWKQIFLIVIFRYRFDCDNRSAYLRKNLYYSAYLFLFLWILARRVRPFLSFFSLVFIIKMACIYRPDFNIHIMLNLN